MTEQDPLTKQLREHAEFLLENAHDDIDKGQDVWPKAHIIGGDGKVAIMMIDPAMMATPATKNGLVLKIKEIIAQKHAVGVVFMSDIWTAAMTVEQAHKRKMIEQMLGQPMGIPELAASGLCSKQEALMVIIHNGSQKTVIKHDYVRGGNKQILWGERTEHRIEEGEYSGRMLDWL